MDEAMLPIIWLLIIYILDSTRLYEDKNRSLVRWELLEFWIWLLDIRQHKT